MPISLQISLLLFLPLLIGVSTTLILSHLTLSNSLSNWYQSSAIWLREIQKNKLFNMVYVNKIIVETQLISADFQVLQSFYNKIYSDNVVVNEESKDITCSTREYEQNLCEEYKMEQQSRNFLYLNQWFHRDRFREATLSTIDEKYLRSSLNMMMYSKVIYNTRNSSLVSVDRITQTFNTTLLVSAPSRLQNFNKSARMTCIDDQGLENFDPRCRPWYINTFSSNRMDLGFNSLKEKVFKEQDDHNRNQGGEQGYNVVLHSENGMVFHHKDWSPESGILTTWPKLEYNSTAFTESERSSFETNVTSLIDSCKEFDANHGKQLNEQDSRFFFEFTKNNEPFLSILLPIEVKSTNLNRNETKPSFNPLVIGRVHKDLKKVILDTSFAFSEMHLKLSIGGFSLVFIVMFAALLYFTAVLRRSIDIPIGQLKIFLLYEGENILALQEEPLNVEHRDQRSIINRLIAAASFNGVNSTQNQPQILRRQYSQQQECQQQQQQYKRIILTTIESPRSPHAEEQKEQPESFSAAAQVILTSPNERYLETQNQELHKECKLGEIFTTQPVATQEGEELLVKERTRNISNRLTDDGFLTTSRSNRVTRFQVKSIDFQTNHRLTESSFPFPKNLKQQHRTASEKDQIIESIRYPSKQSYLRYTSKSQQSQRQQASSEIRFAQTKNEMRGLEELRVKLCPRIVDLNSIRCSFKEMKIIVNAFQKMENIIKLAKFTEVKGQTDNSLIQYSNLIRMFQISNNFQGLSSSYTHIGILLLKKASFEEAVIAFEISMNFTLTECCQVDSLHALNDGLINGMIESNFEGFAKVSYNLRLLSLSLLLVARQQYTRTSDMGRLTLSNALTYAEIALRIVKQAESKKSKYRMNEVVVRICRLLVLEILIEQHDFKAAMHVFQKIQEDSVVAIPEQASHRLSCFFRPQECVETDHAIHAYERFLHCELLLQQEHFYGNCNVINQIKLALRYSDLLENIILLDGYIVKQSLQRIYSLLRSYDQEKILAKELECFNAMNSQPYFDFVYVIQRDDRIQADFLTEIRSTIRSIHMQFCEQNDTFSFMTFDSDSEITTHTQPARATQFNQHSEFFESCLSELLVYPRSQTPPVYENCCSSASASEIDRCYLRLLNILKKSFEFEERLMSSSSNSNQREKVIVMFTAEHNSQSKSQGYQLALNLVQSPIQTSVYSVESQFSHAYSMMKEQSSISKEDDRDNFQQTRNIIYAIDHLEDSPDVWESSSTEEILQQLSKKRQRQTTQSYFSSLFLS